MTTPHPAIVDVARAFEFAASRHAGQSRKGASRAPYINHLAEVGRMLAQATGGRDPELVIAGLLHDVIEDGHASAHEIEAAFGHDVLAMVLEVTDDPELDERERKQRQVDTAASKSARARMLKLADKTSNIREIVRDPPVDWTTERKREYVEWGRQVADRCRGVDPQLEAWFDEAYGEGLARLSHEK